MDIKEYLKELTNNKITKKQAQKIQLEPMGDDTIRKYFPDARTLVVSELSNYNNIDELLPNNNNYVFLLYQSSKNNGHWVLLTKYNNTIEYFDSYGGAPDNPYKWTSLNKRKLLGESKPYLSILLSNSNYPTNYNKFDFQNEDNLNIATCGRWCCFRLKTILNNNLSLPNFKKLLDNLKSNTNLTYDLIVSDLINKI